MFTIRRNKKAENLKFFKKGVNNARKYVYHVSTVRKNLRVRVRGGRKVEGMTNEQFKLVIQMIIQIIKDSETKEDAIKKIEALLDK